MENIKTVLALGAHPDDLELGCGATLAKLAARNVRIVAVIFSDGDRGCSSEYDRSRETRTALETLGVETIVQHAFPDTRLHENINELIAAIEHEVQGLNPDRVYTMFDKDRHQDHRAVHQASMVACRMVPQIFGYETPSSYPSFMPTLYEPVEDFVEAKVAALKMHSSQEARLYMQEIQIRSAANFRGVQVGLGQSEGFIPYKIVL